MIVAVPKGTSNTVYGGFMRNGFISPVGMRTSQSITSGVGRGVLTEKFPWLGLLGGVVHFAEGERKEQWPAYEVDYPSQ